jgi:hypothetical protein
MQIATYNTCNFLSKNNSSESDATGAACLNIGQVQVEARRTRAANEKIMTIENKKNDLKDINNYHDNTYVKSQKPVFFCTVIHEWISS